MEYLNCPLLVAFTGCDRPIEWCLLRVLLAARLENSPGVVKDVAKFYPELRCVL